MWLDLIRRKKSMLIEARIRPGQWKLSHIISQIKKESQISLGKVHRVPHLTLFGNFKINPSQVKRVKEIISSVGRKYSFLPYTIDGVGWVESEKGKVVYFRVVPSEELERFRKEIADKLLQVAHRTKSFDKLENFLFHITIAFKLPDEEFKRAWHYASHNLSNLYLPMYALRVTLLGENSKIVCEYDFLQKRLLPRKEALDKSVWQKTYKIFRIKKEMETKKTLSKRLSQKLLKIFKIKHAKAIYLISDLHLDHKNIIRYCLRPFVNVDEMNRTLVNNWNNVVGNDTVFFLGDLSFGRNSRPPGYWLKRLSGNINFIKGDHDYQIKNSRDFVILEYKGFSFLLVHDPDNLPIKWDGWIIHGHKHNNDMRNYPFINGKRRTINVSAELVNYKPVSLDFIVSLNLESIERQNFIDSEPKIILKLSKKLKYFRRLGNLWVTRKEEEEQQLLNFPKES